MLNMQTQIIFNMKKILPLAAIAALAFFAMRKGAPTATAQRAAVAPKRILPPSALKQAATAATPRKAVTNAEQVINTTIRAGQGKDTAEYIGMGNIY